MTYIGLYNYWKYEQQTMAYISSQNFDRCIEDLENGEGTIHLLAMTQKALGECNSKLDILVKETLTLKEIDERNAHLGNFYQLLERLEIVYATMVVD